MKILKNAMINEHKKGCSIIDIETGSPSTPDFKQKLILRFHLKPAYKGKIYIHDRSSVYIIYHR